MRKLYLSCLAGCLLALNTQASAQSPPRRYVDPLPGVIVTTNHIPFGKSINDKGILQTHLLDIYDLRGDTVKRRPVVVLIHGGNFTGGDKVHMAEYARQYAQRGYLAVLVNYRLSTKPLKNEIGNPNLTVALDDAKEDVFGAIRWLRANATQWRLDKGRLGVMGFSAGATIAFSVNSEQETQRQENDAALDQSTAISTIVELVGLTDPALISPTDKPVMMIHGETDTGIKKESVLVVYQTFQANQVPVKLRFAPGGHDMAPYIKEIGAVSSEWFKTFLVDARPVY